MKNGTGTFTDRLEAYPFDKKQSFFYNGSYVVHYQSKRILAQEINGVLTIIRIDINGNNNWWYLNEYQTCFLLDNPDMPLDFIKELFEFKYPAK